MSECIEVIVSLHWTPGLCRLLAYIPCLMYLCETVIPLLICKQYWPNLGAMRSYDVSLSLSPSLSLSLSPSLSIYYFLSLCLSLWHTHTHAHTHTNTAYSLSPTLYLCEWHRIDLKEVWNVATCICWTNGNGIEMCGLFLCGFVVTLGYYRWAFSR